MAVALDANGTADTPFHTVTTATDTHLTIGTINNTVLIIEVSWDVNTVSAITVQWDGLGTPVAATLVKSNNTAAAGKTEIYGLINPVTGNKQIKATWTTIAGDCFIHGESWTGVDQTGGATTFPHTASGSGTGTPTTTVTSAVGNATVAAHGVDAATSTPTQTQLYIDNTGANINAAASRAAGAASVTHAWTSAGNWVSVSIDIQAAGSVSAPIVGQTPSMWHPGAGIYNQARFRSTYQAAVAQYTPQVFTANLTASLTFIGVFPKQTNRTQTGSVSFVGDFQKTTKKTLVGGLSFVGSLVKLTSRGLTAGLTFVGNLAKKTIRSLSGGLSFVGAFLPSHLVFMAFTAAVSFVGAIGKQTNKSLTGSLSFIGAISKLSSRALTAALNFSGSLAKLTQRAIAGGLSFVGSLATSLIHGGGNLYLMAMTASVSFAGAMGKMSQKAFTASLGTSGSGIGIAPALILVGNKLALRLKGILYELLD